MATQDLTYGTAGSGYAANAGRGFYVAQHVLDCLLDPLASADTAQLLDVKLGSFVLLAHLMVLTAEGGTLTFDGGDGTNPDGFLDGVDGNAAAATEYSSAKAYTIGSGTVIPADADELFGLLGGKHYTANDTIDLLANNAADAGKFRLTAVIIDLIGDAPTASRQ